jgi:glycosyltransferase involved in cell wall biosynthesis
VLPARVDILMVLRPPVETYPPTLFQVAILVEHGLSVAVAQSPWEGFAAEPLPDGVARHTLGPPVARTVFGRALVTLRYALAARRLVRRVRPRVVVAFDAEACAALGGLPRRLGARLVWHFHELPEPQSQGITVRYANQYVYGHADVPDLIVFPDPGRAEVFGHGCSHAPSEILVVANCPRPLESLPAPTLRRDLASQLPAAARVVLYHGAVGPNHGLELAVQSMPAWPAGWFFVAKGRCKGAYRDHLLGLARTVGVAGRVILHDPGFQSYQAHLAFVAGADVAWTALEPTSRNWTYSAYASNKRFEAMALGIPQITNAGPNMTELFERTGCGVCIRTDDVGAASRLSREFLERAPSDAGVSERCRQMHLREFNYDRQYAEVLRRILSWRDAGPKKGPE